MFLFALELMISKSSDHRQCNKFVGFFMIKPINVGGPMLSAENWYLSNHSPLMRIYLTVSISLLPARGSCVSYTFPCTCVFISVEQIPTVAFTLKILALPSYL